MITLKQLNPHLWRASYQAPEATYEGEGTGPLHAAHELFSKLRAAGLVIIENNYTARSFK